MSILVRLGAVSAVLATVTIAGCGGSPAPPSVAGSSSPAASSSPPPQAPSTGANSTSGTGAGSTGTDPSGSSTASGDVVATFHFKDTVGDSVTATYSLGSPVPEAQMSAVASGASACAGNTNIDANIVIPVTVTATLNSDVGMSADFSFSNSGFNQIRPPNSPSALLATFVYDDGQSGYACDNGASDDGAGVALTLAQGSPVSTTAWIVLSGAISPDYPDGDPASIGVSAVLPNFVPQFSPTSESSYSGSGPAVCTDGASGPLGQAGAWALHIGGKTYPSESCGAHVHS